MYCTSTTSALVQEIEVFLVINEKAEKAVLKYLRKYLNTILILVQYLSIAIVFK